MQSNAAKAIHSAYWNQFRTAEHNGLYAVALYDWLLCLEEERNFLSTRGFSFAKAAYLLSRYWPLLTHPINMWFSSVDHVPQAACARTYRVVMALQVGNFIGSASIITLRVHAFSGRQRAITIALCVGILGVVAYQVWVALGSAKFVAGRVCHPVESGKAKFLGGYVVAPLFWDCIAFAITSVYVVHTGSWRNIATRGRSYTNIFLRDGLAYFAVIFIIHLFNTVMTFQSDTALRGAGIPASLLIPNILVCRLLLHLRSATQDKRKDTECASTYIAFAAIPSARNRTRPEDSLAPGDDMKDELETYEHEDLERPHVRPVGPL